MEFRVIFSTFLLIVPRFIKVPREVEIILTQRGIRANPLNFFCNHHCIVTLIIGNSIVTLINLQYTFIFVL